MISVYIFIGGMVFTIICSAVTSYIVVLKNIFRLSERISVNETYIQETMKKCDDTMDKLEQISSQIGEIKILIEKKQDKKKEVVEVVVELKEEGKFDKLTYAIVQNKNEWHLVKVLFSLDDDFIKKEIIRSDAMKAIITEEFKISMARDVL